MKVTSERLFHLVSARNPPPPASHEAGFGSDDASALRFLARFGSALDLREKRVLDVGCGTGSLCIEAARLGATRVVGIDMQLVDVARHRLREQTTQADVVEFVDTKGDLGELGETFDVIFSKDSFEHYADPEHFVHVITQFLAPGGSLVTGFGPPWRAPTGGHIEYMTKLPWAHLVFSEAVIMNERRRFRPDEDAERFEDIIGGLNKVTVQRFQSLMASSGLDCTYFATNVSDKAWVRVVCTLSRLAPLRELFTINVYSIWRKPLTPAGPVRED